jgi:hypothetical protein
MGIAVESPAEWDCEPTAGSPAGIAAPYLENGYSVVGCRSVRGFMPGASETA